MFKSEQPERAILEKTEQATGQERLKEEKEQLKQRYQELTQELTDLGLQLGKIERGISGIGSSERLGSAESAELAKKTKETLEEEKEELMPRYEELAKEFTDIEIRIGEIDQQLKE